MAGLTGSTIASSYEQLLIVADGGLTDELQAMQDGDGGVTSCLKIAKDKLEIIPNAANNANLFEVSQYDGTSILNINSTTPTATLIGALDVGSDGAGHDVTFYSDTASAQMKWNDAQNTGLVIGADGTGSDVKFFGDTASRYWQWDQSADGVVQRGTLTVGVDDTGHDVKLFGATASRYLLWDESADDLIVVGGMYATGGVGTANTVFGVDAGNILDANSGYNTFIGYHVANAVMDASSYNTGVGYNALGALTEGDYNIAIGAGTCVGLTEGTYNIAIGVNALQQATTSADHNIAFGFNSMSGAWTSANVDNCIAIGQSAMDGVLTSNASGAVAIGASALGALTSGADNLAIGYNASLLLTTGSSNIAIGARALDAADLSESYNVAIGVQAMGGVDEGSHGSNEVDSNIAIGYNALLGGAFGSNDYDLKGNIAIGHEALKVTATNAQTGTIAIGYNALTALTSGGRNTAIGYLAGDATTTGESNTLLGYNAGGSMYVSSSYNVVMGDDAFSGTHETAVSDKNIAIGYRSLYGAMNGVNGAVAVGYQAGGNITEANYNTLIGYSSGMVVDHASFGITTSGFNTAVGYETMGASSADAITTAGYNTVMGYRAGYELQEGGASNTLIGSTAGTNITTGTKNVAIGKDALMNGSTSADKNVAMGHSAMAGNFGTNAVVECVAIGFQTLDGVLTSAASGAVGVGTGTLGSLTSGAGNTALGYKAGESITSQNYNTTIGYQAGQGAATGITAVGYQALKDCTATGTVGIGHQAGLALTSGARNIAIGDQTLKAMTDGTNNIAIGNEAMINADDSGCDSNIAIGSYAGDNMGDRANISNIFMGTHAGGGTWGGVASYNVGIGTNVMDAAMNGAIKNTAMGYDAMSNLTTGQYNTAIGSTAGTALTTGSNNTFIGYYATGDASGDSYHVRLGHYGGVKYFTGLFTLNNSYTGTPAAGDAAENNAFFVIPAYSHINKIYATVVTLSANADADFIVVIDETLDVASGVAIGGVELLGASSGTGCTTRSQVTQGGESDIAAGSGDTAGVTWVSTIDASTTNSDGWVNAAAQGVYIAHAKANTATDGGTDAQIQLTVEYTGVKV